MALQNIVATSRINRHRRMRLWGFVELFRQRRHLAQLSDDQLNDIGVTRDAAETEANRPIWDAPHHWRH